MNNKATLDSVKALFQAVIVAKQQEEMQAILRDGEKPAIPNDTRTDELFTRVRKMEQDLEHLKDVVDQIEQYLIEMADGSLENDEETPTLSELYVDDDSDMDGQPEPNTPNSPMGPPKKRCKKL